MLWLHKWLYEYGEPVEFRCAKPIGTAVQLLASKTKKMSPMILIASDVPHPTLVGVVEKDKVALQRVLPLTSNLFKPHFYGKFREVDGETVLEGSFRMMKSGTRYMYVYFGFLAFVMLLSVPALFDSSLDLGSRAMPIIIAGTILATMLMIKFGRWWARKDVEWISSEIRGAFS